MNDDCLRLREAHNALRLELGKAPADSFDRDAEIIRNILSPHMELELELLILAGPGQKPENESCELFQRRTSVEKRHLIAALGELRRKTAHEFGPEPRLLLHAPIDDPQRNTLQDDLGQRLGAAELRLVFGETDEVSGK